MPKKTRVKLTLRLAKIDAIQASKKFMGKKVFISGTDQDGYKTSMNQQKDSVTVYRNGSEISL